MNRKGEVTKEKISPENILNQFSRRSSISNILSSEITTSHLSDALRKVSGSNGVLVGVKPIKNSFKIMGKATTVKTSANDWGTVIKGIYASGKGDILVVSCDRDDPAVWGEMASTSSKQQGLLGTVIYGASRDIKGIKKLNYPVFSRAVIPNAGKPLAEGEVNIPVICGRTTVNPGDFIMGDECGVVSVPIEFVDKVFEEACNILEYEDLIVRHLKDGESFLEILGIK
jgi:3-hexulose-6-phosphate synthase